MQSQIQAANEDYFIRVETATAAAGSYELAFPSDVWGNKLRGVWWYDNTSTVAGQAYRVAPTQLENVYSNMHISGIPYQYTYHAGFIRWAPVPTSPGVFRFIYAMKEDPFVNGSDVLGQIADEHTDCIALYAAIVARDKVGADTKALSSFYQTRMSQIINDVQPTDPSTTPQVRIDL